MASPAQRPAAAFLPVGTWSVRARIWPFLLHEQGQAAFTSSLSLPTSPHHPSAPPKASCSPPSLTALASLSTFPVLASMLGALQIPSQGLKEAVSNSMFLRLPLCISQALLRDLAGPAFSPHLQGEAPSVLAQTRRGSRVPCLPSSPPSGSGRPHLDVPPNCLLLPLPSRQEVAIAKSVV